GNATFKDQTEAWGFTKPSFSNGAAYSDLDNDGDLDVVINNINDSASIYRNNFRDDKGNHYFEVKLQGDSLNVNGIGAWIEIYYDGRKQVYEHQPSRGYLSSHQMSAHFGLGNIAKIDSLVVKWPDNSIQILRNIPVDTLYTVKISNAKETYKWSIPVLANPIFTEISDSIGINFVHEENDFIDFNIQKLLPHKFSEYGPSIAAGDVDGNGLEDLVISGSVEVGATIYLQQHDGKFIKRPFIEGLNNQNKRWEEIGIALFDADGDNDLDAYITSGGYESPPNSVNFQDHFYLNDGKGNFRNDTAAIPRNYTSKSCVRAADFDKDGDIDLFIGGRVDPGNYPRPVSSFLYRNDSGGGGVKFTDITASSASALQNVGLVSDAIWTDFNNDGWQDLVLAGEWMPLTFLKNNQGKFENITASTGIQNESGWWTSIVSGDFDNDGDIDYIAGNLGLNSFYRASKDFPVKIYAKDFDKNGSFDAIPSIYLPASLTDTTKHEYPVHTRDDLIKQMISFRSKFQNYRSFASSTFEKIFTKEELQGAIVLKATNFNHSLFKNVGNGRFEIVSLPLQAQFSCINGMIAEDFNSDGNLDILFTGNDYGTEVSIGRYDACNGLLMKGDGHGSFNAASILESGIYIPGNGKGLVKLKNGSGGYLLAASENRGRLLVFKSNMAYELIEFDKDDVSVSLKQRNGLARRHEINYGSSSMSQSDRALIIPKDSVSVEITKANGKKRIYRH
ncbi:MAG TPA: FG-GAP-like repeat-containing protein, partial [Flavitalea sp.]|nr:FG-GAP-like repeat-containing protein [Flavitalea sp.]